MSRHLGTMVTSAFALNSLLTSALPAILVIHFRDASG